MEGQRIYLRILKKSRELFQKDSMKKTTEKAIITRRNINRWYPYKEDLYEKDLKIIDLYKGLITELDPEFLAGEIKQTLRKDC